MIRNEAAWDRGLRVVLGLGLLSMVVVGPHTLWGLVGLVPLATGLAGHCPLYRICGLATCSPTKTGA
jgi:Inner membrane protein YgaP-like, transmembrane domain